MLCEVVGVWQGNCTLVQARNGYNEYLLMLG